LNSWLKCHERFLQAHKSQITFKRRYYWDLQESNVTGKSTLNWESAVLWAKDDIISQQLSDLAHNLLSLKSIHTWDNIIIKFEYILYALMCSCGGIYLEQFEESSI
jgi:hypothetical protein